MNLSTPPRTPRRHEPQRFLLFLPRLLPPLPRLLAPLPRLRPSLPRLPLLFCLLSLALCFLLRPGAAFAHGVYIFAWPENGRICTESYFSKNSRVRGGEVRMEDADGILLASGVTDAEGGLCFDAPQTAMDLRFSVSAGQGHRGEFRLPAASVTEALPAAPDALSESAPAPESGAAATKVPAVAAPAGGVASETLLPAIRAIVREEVRNELSPLHRALAAGGRDGVRNEGPTLRDVTAGLGWIVGLAGLGAAYAARRKKD